VGGEHIFEKVEGTVRIDGVGGVSQPPFDARAFC
jgi:hypothetical protein